MSWLMTVMAVETNILPGDMCVGSLLMLVVNILVYGLGAAAVLGTVIAGVMYLTARDKEAQVTAAKTRLYNIVIGLIAWAVMFAVMNWLIPGGLDFSAATRCPETTEKTETTEGTEGVEQKTEKSEPQQIESGRLK